jgi:hypothetical protein
LRPIAPSKAKYDSSPKGQETISRKRQKEKTKRQALAKAKHTNDAAAPSRPPRPKLTQEEVEASVTRTKRCMATKRHADAKAALKHSVATQMFGSVRPDIQVGKFAPGELENVHENGELGQSGHFKTLRLWELNKRNFPHLHE